MVSPSGAALIRGLRAEIAAGARLVPTTSHWPSRALIFWRSTGMVKSEPPPGANGATIFIGRDGPPKETSAEARAGKAYAAAAYHRCPGPIICGGHCTRSLLQRPSLWRRACRSRRCRPLGPRAGRVIFTALTRSQKPKVMKVLGRHVFRARDNQPLVITPLCFTASRILLGLEHDSERDLEGGRRSCCDHLGVSRSGVGWVGHGTISSFWWGTSVALSTFIMVIDFERAGLGRSGSRAA